LEEIQKEAFYRKGSLLSNFMEYYEQTSRGDRDVYI